MTDAVRRPHDPAPIDLDFENKGLLAGGQAGFDVQSGHIVFGLEGDVSAVDWDDQFTDFQTHGAVDPQTLTLDFDLLATARARIGWANNDQLYYITGGLGFLQGEFKDGGGHANTVTPGGLSRLYISGFKGRPRHRRRGRSRRRMGVAPNLSVKAEGLYLAFNNDIDLSGLTGVGAPGDHLKIGDSFAFRVGGNWRPGHAAGVTPASATEHDPAAPYNWSGFYGGAQGGWGGLVTEGIYNPSGDPFDVANKHRSHRR